MAVKSQYSKTVNQETLTNIETFIEVYKYTLEKAASPLLKTFLMGLAAGLFVGIGYIGAIYATRGWTTNLPIGIKNLVFGMVFTIAITMIIFMGGELFTSNSMMFLGTVKKQIKVSKLLLNLLIVLLGNFIGCAIISATTALAGFFDDKDFVNNAFAIFNHKLRMAWWQALFSGILCNFLVAGSVYIAHSTKSSTAKFLLISLVITVFSLSGFSHVVANSYVWFLVPIFNLYGHSLSFSQFLQFGYQNQLPTLLGNFIGGGILLPGMYYIVYKKNLPNPITL